MERIGFWGSILGGLIGGIFTYIGVVATLKYQNKIKKEEDGKKKKSLLTNDLILDQD